MESTTPLSDLVGSVLDSSSGLTATCFLPLFDHHAAFIGTSKGSLLLCTPADAHESGLFEPACDFTLHCGPVYDVALSTQHLVATAGHDAVSCVFPLHAVCQEGGLQRCRRLCGHSAPVVAVRFLSDGTTLLSLSADGHVRVVDVVRGTVLAALHTNMAATCLTCSMDETTLFVAGRRLASVDLYAAMRPSALHSAAALEAWAPVTAKPDSDDPHATTSAVGGALQSRTSAGVRFFQWTPSHDESQSDCASGSGERSAKAASVSETPHGVFITQLQVSAEDNTLTAVFTRGTPNTAKGHRCGAARWPSEGGKVALETIWTSTSSEVEKKLLDAPTRKNLKSVAVRCRAKTAPRTSAKQSQSSAASSSSATAAAALWHGRWYTSPFELSGDAGVQRIAQQTLSAVTAAATAHTAAHGTLNAMTDLVAEPTTHALTRGEEVALAEERCAALQRECDALVFQLRNLRAEKVKGQSV